jgi:hypothetical protein
MENIETKLEWIKDVAEKLQVPQTYNERQRLTKIMVEAMPLIIEALESSAHTGYGQYGAYDDGQYDWIPFGYSCNGCGRDHKYEVNGVQEVVECEPFTDRDGVVTRTCKVTAILKFLKQLETKN